jgi:hypothetical protein
MKLVCWNVELEVTALLLFLKNWADFLLLF